LETSEQFWYDSTLTYMQVELEQLEDNKYWMTVAIYQKQANGPTDLLHDFQRVIYRDEFIRS